MIGTTVALGSSLNEGRGPPPGAPSGDRPHLGIDIHSKCCRPPSGFTPLRNSQDLEEVRKNPRGKYYLCNSIVLADEIEPLGTFAGVFEGNYKAILGLRIDRPDDSRVGLFDSISGVGEVHNLTFVGPKVRGMTNVGTLAGVTSGMVTNVRVIGEGIIEGMSNVGGIAGLSCCGISTLSRVFVGTRVSVLGDRYIGGVVGSILGGRLTQSDSRAQVTASDAFAGGIAGRVSGESAEVISSVSRGMTVGERLVGGIAGGNLGTVLDCYVEGDVAGTSTVGGIVGFNQALIERTYFSGMVAGIENVGGIVGSPGGLAQTKDSFYSVDVNPGLPSTESQGIGKTDEELRILHTYSNWAISPIDHVPISLWRIDSSIDFPRLFWELPAP